MRDHSPNSYIHVSVNDLYNPAIGLPILLQENRCTDRGNIRTVRSKTHECPKLGVRPCNSLFWEYINRKLFAVQWFTMLSPCRVGLQRMWWPDRHCITGQINTQNDHKIIVKLMQMSCCLFSFEYLSTGGATGLDFPAQSSPTVSKMASSVKKLRKLHIKFSDWCLSYHEFCFKRRRTGSSGLRTGLQ